MIAFVKIFRTLEFHMNVQNHNSCSHQNQVDQAFAPHITIAVPSLFKKTQNEIFFRNLKT